MYYRSNLDEVYGSLLEYETQRDIKKFKKLMLEADSELEDEKWEQVLIVSWRIPIAEEVEVWVAGKKKESL